MILLRGTKCAAHLDRDIVWLIFRVGGHQSCWIWADGFPVLDVLHLMYCFVSLNLLLSLKPHCHLRVLILFVGSGICVFGIIDVQPFSVLSIEVVGGAKKGNEVDIMAQKMEFGDVEVIPNAKINEDVFVCVEAIEGVPH